MWVFVKVIGGCDIKVGKVVLIIVRNVDFFVCSFGVIND